MKFQNGWCGMENFLILKNISKTFNNTVHVLDNLNLTIKKGEFVSIIGPSGCGKSTLLKLIAGLDVDYRGEIYANNKKVTKPSSDRGFIFQEHRLFPWHTVEKNIAGNLSLKDSKVQERIKELITLVKLNGFEKAYPKQLSGGMSQRVSIARSFLRNPDILLLDEPFGALDAFTRAHLQESLLETWKHNETTMILVTHDIDEAIFLSTRVIVMDSKPGKIKANIPIDIPFPRDRTSRATQEYRNLILQHLYKPQELTEEWSI